MKDKLAVRDWHWEITRDCNLKCIHCIVGDRRSYELTTQESFLAISRIVQFGGKNLRITGGEPFRRKDLGLIIKEANLSGLDIDLITNGTMIDDVFLKKYRQHIKHIAVSIDGQEKTHEYIRGKGTYKKAILALQKIMDFDIDLSVYITVHSLNENFIGTLTEELISVGVRNFHFSEINMEGRASENKNLSLETKKTKDRLKSLLSQLDRIIDTSKPSSDLNCSISPESVYLQSDGKIYICSEIAFKSPQQKISHILTSEAKNEIAQFFLKELVQKPFKCRYSLFNMSGISILFNELKECPILKRKED